MTGMDVIASGWLAQTRGASGESALPGLLVAVGVGIVALSIWWSLRKKLLTGGASARETSAEKINRVRSRLESRRSEEDRIGELMVDAEELARRLAGLLDNKAERVERLLDRAEARLAELESRERALERSGGRPAAVPAAEEDDVVDEDEAPVVIVRGVDDPVAEDVYRLADGGKSSVEIAKELGEHTGKVELILALRD